MKKLFALIPLIMSLNCAYKDPVFQPYVDKVLMLCDEYKCDKQQRINEISISFGNNEDNEGAYAGLNGIKVNKKKWDTYTENTRLILILHELGHEIWNKEHDVSINEKRQPLSIMYPYAQGISYIKWDSDKDYQSELLAEFFQQ
jgi:hypothetical protein